MIYDNIIRISYANRKIDQTKVCRMPEISLYFGGRMGLRSDLCTRLIKINHSGN